MTKKRVTRFLLLLFTLQMSACTTDLPDPAAELYFPLPEDPGERIVSEEMNFYLQPLVSGLVIPWGMAFLPDGTILVSERAGTIRVIRDGTLLEEPIDGVPEVTVGGTSGLLDIAVHPDYEENGWIYIAYSSSDGDAAHNTAIMRARFTGHELVDREVLFRGEPLTERPSHSGSRILFRDGYLYFSIGDRGTPEWAQLTDRHAGSILRLYDDGRVPEENPFTGEEGFLPEIYSYGHRNPQGMAFDPGSRDFWVVEHGPRGGDELNLIKKGGNYGWPLISPSGIADDGTVITEAREMEGMISARYDWTPALAPSSLMFIDSDRYQVWRHHMLIGGLAGMRLVRLVVEDRQVVHEESLLEGIGRIRNVRMGPDGWIYLANEVTGELLRILPESFDRQN